MAMGEGFEAVVLERASPVGFAVIELAGVVAGPAVDELVAVLASQLLGPRSSVLMDLTRLAEVDTLALEVLATAAAHAVRSGGAFRLIGASGQPRALIDELGLAEALGLRT